MVKVVIGAQFGSEGKGKVAKFLGKNCNFAIRCGGPNSGHTVVHKGKKIVLKQLPVNALDGVFSVIPAGGNVNPEILLKEIKDFDVDPKKVLIHPNASVITNENILSEYQNSLNKKIGSTESGTGYSIIEKIKREKHATAKNNSYLEPFVNTHIEEILEQTDNIIIEGTQGYGLSINHSPYYPYTTSRDTTVMGFLSETGIPLTKVTEIVLVIRTFPIRVAGNSGPLPFETTWEKIGITPEFTSVTRKMRRVSFFDPWIVNKAIKINSPNIIVLNHCDYMEDTNSVEKSICRPVNFFGFGPGSLEKC